jgi:hypothetical protein
MWNALRSDMKEFVSTVTADTSTVLSTLDANFPDDPEVLDSDDEVDASKDMDTPHAQEALRRMNLTETFITPLEVVESEDDDDAEAVEMEKKELAEYLESFSIDAKTDEIAQLLSDHPGTLKVMFEDIVPATVSYEHFWQAYFYRCDADRIERQWAEEDERARAARQARMTAGISSVKNFWGGAVQAVSASLSESDDQVDGSTGQVMEKKGIFGATGRPPFVMNTAVDEDDEEEEEELGWDDDDDDLDDLDNDEEESGVESSMEQIEFSDQATEKLQEELRQALEERDQLHETVELQHNVISLLQSEKDAGAGAGNASGEGNNIEVETLKMQLWEKDSELAAMKAGQLDDSDEKEGSLQEEVDLLKEKLEEKDLELSEMQTLMQNSVEMLQQITAEREQETATLDEALTKSMDKSELESKTQALNDQVAMLQSENKGLRESLESAQGDSKSESVKLEQELASSEKQVAALTMEVESLKTSLTSAETRASTFEEELLSTEEILKKKEENEIRLQSELSAAKESHLEKEESEARLEEELRAANEILSKKEEEEVAVSSEASPTDTVSTGVNVEAPTLAEKLAAEGDDWGDDWGDDD